MDENQVNIIEEMHNNILEEFQKLLNKRNAVQYPTVTKNTMDQIINSAKTRLYEKYSK
jgi:uncharacterized membrane-anchored protein